MNVRGRWGGNFDSVFLEVGTIAKLRNMRWVVSLQALFSCILTVWEIRRTVLVAWRTFLLIVVWGRRRSTFMKVCVKHARILHCMVIELILIFWCVFHLYDDTRFLRILFGFIYSLRLNVTIRFICRSIRLNGWYLDRVLLAVTPHQVLLHIPTVFPARTWDSNSSTLFLLLNSNPISCVGGHFIKLIL